MNVMFQDVLDLFHDHLYLILNHILFDIHNQMIYFFQRKVFLFENQYEKIENHLKVKVNRKEDYSMYLVHQNHEHEIELFEYLVDYFH